MIAITGAGGNVGFSTVSALRKAGIPVRAVLHAAEKASKLEALGCEIAIADLQEPTSLARAMRGADAVQIIVPLRPMTADPVEDMRRSVEALVVALERARAARVLAISDYGAHVREDIGMPTIFHELEERLVPFDGQKTILRSAEHMHNVAPSVPTAIERGSLTTFQDPVDMPQPAIAARDLGTIAAELLLCDETYDMQITHAEGPRRYSASDTAAILSRLSGHTIETHVVPRAAWQEALEHSLPPRLASLLIRTYDAKNRGGLVDVEPGAGRVRYGTTELIDALRPLLPH